MFHMKRFKFTSCISRISWHNGVSLLVKVIYRTPIGSFSSEKAASLICFRGNSAVPKGVLRALHVQIKIWQLGVI